MLEHCVEPQLSLCVCVSGGGGGDGWVVVVMEVQPLPLSQVLALKSLFQPRLICALGLSLSFSQEAVRTRYLSHCPTRQAPQDPRKYPSEHLLTANYPSTFFSFYYYFLLHPSAQGSPLPG